MIYPHITLYFIMSFLLESLHPLDGCVVVLHISFRWVTNSASEIIHISNWSQSKISLSYLPPNSFLLSFSGVSGRMDPEALLWLAVISPGDILPLSPV